MASLTKLAFKALLGRMGPKRMFHMAARARKAELTDELVRAYGATVQSGPFAGMELPSASSWGDGDRATKLLGCYEANLHEPIRQAVARAPARVVNVGCAEGYYAIGLARLLPGAQVFAYDIDTAATRVCAQAAQANGVTVTTGGECTTALLADHSAGDGRTLLVIDCEGAELDLLDPDKVPGLARCDILVECHDFVDHSITATLQRRLGPTHALELLHEGGRDPHLVPAMAGWAELDRWLVVDEGRPESMTWLACWAKP
ncbi:MAG: class I SAM-dependent methyltransferase [Actinomycetota bacterium]